MHGTGHRITAATSWAVTAHTLGLPWWQVAGGIPIAAAFSAGPTSPDIDNARTFKRLDRFIPDEVLGDGGPLGHREFMHWWGIPTLLAALLAVSDPDPMLAWALWAAILGWASHLAGDFIFGMPGYGTPLGIPLGPWWWHAGLGLRSGGLIERIAVPLVALAAVGLTVYLGVTS